MTLDGLTVSQIRQRARTEAARVLAEHWPFGTVPVDPVYVARSLGASVFSAELGDDAWGMLIGSPSGVDIYLDRDQPETRFRFSCAHEVGHLVERGGNVHPEEAFVDKRSSSGHGRAEEIYANEFAASVLMPENDFVASCNVGMDNFALASRFNVSLDSVSWRRRHLQV